MLFAIVFAVKMVNFLMFAVSEESTFKCLEGSSVIFGSLRKSEINCRKMAENSLIYYTK